MKDINNVAQSFCFKKGFIITPELTGSSFKIKYKRGVNEKYYKDGAVFQKKQVYKEIWQLYLKIYKHYNKL